MLAEMGKSIEVLVRRNSLVVKERIQWLVGSQFMPFSILSVLQQRDHDLTVEAGINFSSHQTKTSIVIGHGRFDYTQKITFKLDLFSYFQYLASKILLSSISKFLPLKFLSFLFLFFISFKIFFIIGLLFLKFHI